MKIEEIFGGQAGEHNRQSKMMLNKHEKNSYIQI
jgi:hypothetical protein